MLGDEFNAILLLANQAVRLRGPSPVYHNSAYHTVHSNNHVVFQPVEEEMNSPRPANNRVRVYSACY